MRPQRCAQDHELVWLTTRLAVCPDCDADAFIYHYDGYIERLAHCLAHVMQTGAQAAWHVRWWQGLSIRYRLGYTARASQVVLLVIGAGSHHSH